MRSISYSIPRWQTAISCGQCQGVPKVITDRTHIRHLLEIKLLYEKLKDINEVFRCRKLKDRQYNCQEKNNGSQITNSLVEI